MVPKSLPLFQRLGQGEPDDRRGRHVPRRVPSDPNNVQARLLRKCALYFTLRCGREVLLHRLPQMHHSPHATRNSKGVRTSCAGNVGAETEISADDFDFTKARHNEYGCSNQLGNRLTTRTIGNTTTATPDIVTSPTRPGLKVGCHRVVKTLRSTRFEVAVKGWPLPSNRRGLHICDTPQNQSGTLDSQGDHQGISGCAARGSFCSSPPYHAPPARQKHRRSLPQATDSKTASSTTLPSESPTPDLRGMQRRLFAGRRVTFMLDNNLQKAKPTTR